MPPPAFSLPPRRAPYIVTDAAPRELSHATCSLDAKTLVVFQDLSGPTPTHPMVFEILDTIAKLVIHDVRNLQIAVRRGVITTLEVHDATNLSLVLDSLPATSAFANGNDPAGSDNGEKANYGTISLDPSLHSVDIAFTHRELVGAVVFTSPSSSQPTSASGVSDLRLRVQDGPDCQLADRAGLADVLQAGERGASAHSGRQYHVYFDKELREWQIRGLERNEKDYPALGKD